MNTTRKNTRKNTAASAPIVSFIFCALMVLATLQTASANDLPDGAAQPARGTCTFSLQLHKSVEAQREYLVKLDHARGITQTAKNSVAEGYRNVKPATSSAEETAEVAWSAAAAGFGLE
jgi:hypothetical protein